MKRAKFIIDTKGGVEIDLGEGFSGLSCLEKAKEIEILIGGTETDSKLKDSYYEGDSLMSDIFVDR